MTRATEHSEYYDNSGRLSRPLFLSLYMLSTALAALSLAFASTIDLFHFGLKWSTQSGTMILSLTATLALIAIVQKVGWRVVVVVAILLAAMLVEKFQLPRYIWVSIGIALCVGGQAVAFSACRPNALWRSGVWALVSYIEAVFIYNILNPYQLTTFFSGGVVRFPMSYIQQ